MTVCRAIVVALGLTALLISSPAAPAADWPSWGGGQDGRNRVSQEKGLAEAFVPGEKDPQGGGVKLETAKNVKWVARIGAMTCSTPAIAGGKIFVGTMRDDQGVFLCLDEATGKPIWQWRAPVREDVPQMVDGRKFEFSRFPRQLGVCSSAAVEGDRVYFVTHRLEVVCMSTAGKPKAAAPPAVKRDLAAPEKPASGKSAPAKPAAPAKGKEPAAETKSPWPEAPRDAEVLWTFDMWALGVRPSDACNCSPVVSGDFVYVLTANGIDRQAEAAKHDEFRKVPAPDAPNLIVLEKKTGRLVALDDVRMADRMLHGQWSSPSLGKVGVKTLIFMGGGDGRCYAYEAPTAAAQKPAKLRVVWSVDCNPPEYMKFGDLDMITHYCRGDRRRSDTINLSNGTFVGMSEIIATPVFYKNRVYVGIGRDPAHGRGRGALWCIDAAKTGDITQSGKVWCYQGLDRTLSTVSIADGLLYVADVAGRCHCLDAETGHVYWVHDGNSQTWGSTLVADGKVYMPTEKALWVLAAGKEKKVLAKMNLGAPAWASPVAANGILFITSRHYMWAVQEKGEVPSGSAVPAPAK